MPKRIRIVSDLHLGHRASMLEDLAALRPLAEGIDCLIFNGDTLELKYGDLDTSRYDAVVQKGLFDKEVARWGIETKLITGNHDPAVSDLHSLSLLDGALFITHGDGLFEDIAPWSSSIKHLRQSSQAIDPKQTGNSAEDLHNYLALHKKASIEAHKLDHRYNPTVWGKTKIFLHQAWPPTTPFRILTAWKEVPDRAVSLVRRFNLSPRFIVVGHTHNPGIWKRGPHTVINLGSYFPWPGARCIDIVGDELVVRKVRKGHNRIELGRPIASFSLSTSRSEKARTPAALGEVTPS